MKILNTESILKCDSCDTIYQYDETDIKTGVYCPCCSTFKELHKVPYKVEETPVTTFKSTDPDDYSLEAFVEMIESGNHPFKIGNTHEIEIDGEIYHIQIIDFDHDVDKDNKSTKATFQLVELLDEMPINKKTPIDWEKCSLRKYLNENFILKLPKVLQAKIKTVRKGFHSYDGACGVVYDRIFIPSEEEIFGKTSYAYDKEGKQYEFYKKWQNRVKGLHNGKYGNWYWARSLRSGYGYYFVFVNSNGIVNYYYASSSFGVSLCFAI